MTISFKTTAAAALFASVAIPALAQTGELPIAVQMYTLRDFGTLEEQLAAVQEAGITAVETVGTQKVEAAELKALLDEYGIEAISTHAQLADLRSDLDSVVAFNKAIGNSYITVPFLKEEDRPTDAAGWQALGEELGQISEKIEAEGLTLAYHNHAFEIVDFDGKTALEIMLDAAGPEVEAELDLAWVARAGFDPAEYLGRFEGRVFAIHAKDNAPEGEAEDEKGFAALGEGVLDWDAILPAAEEAGVTWYIIEHDLPKDAAAVVQTGAAYLTENLPEGATR
ncbi:sugar phosphate isomerase/epimerase [Cereibacter sp. SYSU M97828]|nr:sugar phosphate isomerase/epimerase [Cereibacter flavus]